MKGSKLELLLWNQMILARLAMEDFLREFFGSNFSLADGDVHAIPYEFEIVFIDHEEVDAKMVAFKRLDGTVCIAVIRGRSRVVTPVVGDVSSVMNAIGNAIK